MKISVLGCGRWGSFIAWYLNKIGHEVSLWGREGSPHLRELQDSRKNSFLEFDEKIIITHRLEKAVESAEIIVISISSQSLRAF